jgi:DNA-binding PadR family transcriptional regulator
VLRSSPLKGALLCLLVQQRGYGYDLANRLERRLGPGWNINRRSLYRMLEALERDELASSDRSDEASSDRIMYDATPAAEPVVADWMESIESGLARKELQARLVVARDEDLPRLLGAVNAYERWCFAMQREIEVDLPPRQSLGGAMMYLAREADLKHIGAELSWLESVRKTILAFLGS